MGYSKKNGKTNKEFIKEIYEKLYKKNKRPRPLDYARAIYDKKHENDVKKENEWTIKREVEKKRTTVMKALKQLTEGDDAILGVIDDYFYVPKEVAVEYNSRLYLLDNLHLAQKNVLMISKEVWVIALDKDSYSVPKDEKETETNSLGIELPDDMTLSSETQLLLSCVNELKEEVYNLRSEVKTLRDKEKRRKEKSRKIEEVMENLRLFIGGDYCYNILRNQDNIVIMLDLSDYVEKIKVCQDFKDKLNGLLKEIWERPVPPIKLMKKE